MPERPPVTIQWDESIPSYVLVSVLQAQAHPEVIRVAKRGDLTIVGITVEDLGDVSSLPYSKDIKNVISEMDKIWLIYKEGSNAR